jgi:hypothetical protein
VKEFIGSHILRKALIFLGPYARLMGWFSRIKSEWNDAGIIERFIWLFTILYPFKDFLIWGWKMPAIDIYSAFDIFLYVLLIAAIILNIRTRKDRDTWRKVSDRTRAHLDNLIKKCENKELELLIKPLYLTFDKSPPRNGLSSSLVHQLSTPSESVSSALIFKELVETANLVVDTMQQHRELAQPHLQELIDRYLEMRRTHRELKAPYGPNSVVRYYSDAEKTLNEIADVIKARYDDLTNVK